ncbi:MAG: thioredoxin domain-containing protein [bacterium]
MSARVRPWLLFGGIGLVTGFILGVLTANYGHSQREDAQVAMPESAVRLARPVSIADSTAEREDTTVHVVVTTGRPTRGPDNAPVTIVEFTDYECPYCREYFANTLPLVLARYGDRVRYVVMNLPLSELHPDALGAAEAAECAADQHRFWEYHDRLFLSADLDSAALARIAGEVHLNTAAFATCVGTRATAERVRGHLAQANSLGIRSTPTFYVNGRVSHGAHTFESFKPIIDDAIRRAGH